MESLLIKVPIEKKEMVISFLKKLGIHFSWDRPDFIEPEPSKQEDIFSETFGMWADSNITLESIRRSAWQRE